MDKRFLAEVIGLLILVTILVIPGIFAVGLLSHEFYHYMQHSDTAQAFCFSINQKDNHAFVILENNELDQFDYNLEERNGNRFSRIVTWGYTVVCLFTIIWVMLIVIESKRIRKDCKVKKKKRH